jgi:phage terminase large subunit-like protein
VGLSRLQRAIWEQGAAAVEVPGISKEEVLRNARIGDGKTQLAWLESMSRQQRRAVMEVKKAGAKLVEAALATLPANQQAASSYDWRATGRPEQFAPEGDDWDTWAVIGGRGFGKTMTGAEWIREKVERGLSRRPYIVGATASDVRDVMVEGPSGILAVTPPRARPRFLPSKRRLVWPNGAVGILRSAEKPDRLRGPQGDLAWLDELPAWKYPQDAYDQIKFGLRLGRHPQTCITTTPRPIKLLRDILKDPRTRVTRGTTYDNLDNLSLSFIKDMLRRYANTRLGRQELDAEDLEDNPDALWKAIDIEAKRLSHAEFLKEHFANLTRIVVAIDPATSESPKNAETGIVCCAVGWCSCNGQPEEHGYVLDDESGHLAARAWALAAGTLYQSRRADRVVAETNQGGNLVESNLQANAETKNISYKGVHAKDGKKLRAEPVAALYEQHRVHHVGGFAALEDQMTQWNPKEINTESPDRLDAMVHGLTDLMIGQPATKLYTAATGEQKQWRR